MRQEFANQLVRIAELIEAGILPESAAPRLVAYSYGGHMTLHLFMRPRHEWEFKCVTCLQTFKTYYDPHQCTGTPEVYETNHNRDVRWKCVSCGHEWTAECGDICPECMAGPLTGTLSLLRGTHGLPRSTRERWPILRALDDIRCSGVPQSMVFEHYADTKGIPFEEALLEIATEWWQRVTAQPE
jgi:hypothetical protein